VGDREKVLRTKLWALHAKRERAEIVQALGAGMCDVSFLDLDESTAFAARFRERDIGPSIEGTRDEFWARADAMWSAGEAVVLLLNSWQQTGFAKLSYGILRAGAQSLQARVGPDIFLADNTLERGAVLDVGETATLLRFWGSARAG
jgi:hypothetical protein